MQTYFATTPKGVEPLLADELKALGASRIAPNRGGVYFDGTVATALRANLWLRVAMRVLMPVSGSLPAEDAARLYDSASSVRWDTWLSPRHTFAVEAHGKTPGLIHTHFTAQKIKDAIADQFRARQGSRPSVDRDQPDVRIVAHLQQGRVTLYLDLSGESLHRRGYRVLQTEAPLKEPIAAALLLWAGWDGSKPLADPMCGSGTFSIEAALLAQKRAPNAGRAFGVERWPVFTPSDAALLRQLRQEARGEPGRKVSIFASDISEEALRVTQVNAQAAGVDLSISLARRDVRQLAPLSPPGLVVMNPPYGERLGENSDLLTFYRELGAHLRTLGGHEIVVLSADKAHARALGMMPKRSLPVFNGPIECTANLFEVWNLARR
jgi:putative N6-adenine-specific DNA methylase